MKKFTFLVLVILSCNFCSLFKAKIVPYPSGVVFPVVRDHELSYEGEIISLIQKKDHLLYFSTRDGKLYCFDGQKQELLWRFDIPASSSSSPYLAESRIYIDDDDNNLYCLDSDGELRWKTQFANKITSGVAESGEQVYFGTGKGQLICLNADTGQELWQFQAGDAIRSNLVIWQDTVLFGCDDHQVYFVDKKGMLSGKHDAGGRIGKTLTIDENLLYFGTEDRYLQCLNLKRKKTKWKILSGGATFVPPVVTEKRVLFLCWNCVLYCINKKSGTILWWGSVPSRSYYRVEVIQDKAVVSSFSPKLVCFDIQTGKNQGSFDASQEIKSNPAWFTPFLLVNLHDPENDAGELVFLKKEVKATLFPSQKSPNKKNEEISFTAKGTGFHLPMYEFFLTRYVRARFYPGIILLFREGDREVVQESSELAAWKWFPEEEGFYNIEVVIADEKEKAQTEFPFLIREGNMKVSLSSAMTSPQQIGQKIVFTADSEGLGAPRFEFRLSRLRWVRILSPFPFLFVDKEEIVREASEKDNWTWTPGKEGMYLIKVIAQDGEEKATAHLAFAIKKE
jgi:outer membrane protein assembly factor BamB